MTDHLVNALGKPPGTATEGIALQGQVKQCCADQQKKCSCSMILRPCVLSLVEQHQLLSRVCGCNTHLNPVSESKPLHIQLSPCNSFKILIHSKNLQHSSPAANIGLLV